MKNIPGFLLLAVLALTLTSAPAFAQIDFSGDWAPLMHEDNTERVSGPALGDYLGIPINAAARRRAEIWEASIQTLPEWQCRPHGVDYITSGPSQVRISKEVDPVSRTITAFNAEWLRSVQRKIYLDGRRHPPEWAEHTWAGFSTAHWEGEILTIETTHLKEDYVRRNGLPRSDKATVREHLIRNGDYLTWVTITYDPVYLAAPLIKTREYRLQPNLQIQPYPCTVVSEVDRPPGEVPHNYPGTNTQLHEFSERYNIPFEAAMGGPETAYPEYRSKLKGRK
jgi:hypothetical protein